MLMNTMAQVPLWKSASILSRMRGAFYFIIFHYYSLLLFKEGTVLKLQWRVSTLDDRFRSDMFIDIPCAYLSPETIQGSPLDSQVTVERTIKSDMFR